MYSVDDKLDPGCAFRPDGFYGLSKVWGEAMTRMTNLSELATKTAAVPNPAEGISAIASSPTGLDTTTPIGGWLSSLFGHNVFDVTDSIGRYAGMSGSSAASLLSIAAPLVLGYIGRLIRSDKLTITGLSDLFRGQRAQLAASLPTGFKMSGVGAPYETRRRALKETASTGWSAPLLALLAALGIGGLIWWGRQKPVDIARVDIVEVEPMSKAVGTSGTLPTFSRTLPGNVVITMAGNVWEWTSDWYEPRGSNPAVKSCCMAARARQPCR